MRPFEYFALEQEQKLLELSLQILELRKQKGLTQEHLAKIAHITQQQLSKAERGINCNMLTFLKICHALNIDLTMHHA